MVNANMFSNPFGDGSNPLGVSYGAIYIATAAALIYVGILMMGSVKNIDWDNFKISVPAFLTLSVMPFTYNISYGIAFGLISYIVISTFCGDFKKIKGSSRVITFLFVAMLLLTQ